MNDAKKAGHIAAGKDEVVGQPTYMITEAGTVWLSEQNLTGEPKGKAPKAAVVKDSLSTEKPKAEAQVQKEMDQEVRLTMAGKTIIDFCEWLAQKAQVRCPMNLHECKPIVADAMQASELVADLKTMLADREKSFSEACKTLEARDGDIRRHIQRAEAAERNRDDLLKMHEELTDRAAKAERAAMDVATTLVLIGLNLEFVDGSTINEKVCNIMHERAHDKERIAQLEEMKVAEISSVQPTGFVVSAPKQPMRRFKNNDTAKIQALSFARNFGSGEVFAIYSVGKAIRGAEWRDKA
ncbi:MAG: hypothetical protein PHV02_18100 [Rhodocyclaceae bacterium]|nr:hypothetical protein [Rhodocyclaceae bacterium]